VYLTAHGELTATNWIGETAQMGVRVCFAPNASEPAKGSTFTIMENGDAVADSGTTAGTSGTLTKTWTARIGPVGSTENCDAAAQIDFCEDFVTLLNAVKGYQGSKFRWTHLKIAPISATGAYIQPSAVYQLTTPIVGTGSVSFPMMPPEVALALSFKANVIGRTGRGRMYLPAINQEAMALDGTVGPTQAAALASALATFVGNIDNMAGSGDYDAVLAVTSAGKTTAVRPSTTRVGSHFDAQRRRQHQVPEVYSSVTL